MEGSEIRKLVEKHNPEKPALIVASDQGIIQQVPFQTVLNVADEILPFLSKNISSSNNCIGLLLDKNILVPSIIICLQDLRQSFTVLTTKTLTASCNRLGIQWLLVLDLKPAPHQGGYSLGSHNVGGLEKPCQKTPSNLFTCSQKLPLSTGDELQLWEFGGVPEQTKCYENVFCTMQTSGSTGESKSVRIPYDCIQKNVTGLNRHFQVTGEDVIYWGTPLTFDPSLIELLLGLTFGAPLVIVPAPVHLNPSLLHRALFQVVGISFLQMVPSIFLRFTPEQTKEILLSPLKTLALGGEPFPAELLAYKRHPQLKLFNLYGVTELSCWATIADLSTPGLSQEEVPLGVSLEETFVELRKEEGLIGEICIGSASRHCLLDEVPKGSPVPTGDLGEFIYDRLYFRGRRSRSIKRFGRRVALQSVEEAILLNTQLRSRLVYSTLHQRLLAFVVIAQPMEERSKIRALDKLRVKLLNCLEEHCFPDYLDILTELPLNPHGKVCDKSLEGMCKREVPATAGGLGDVFEDLLRGYVPQLHQEKTLAQLGVSSISIMQFMRDFQERVDQSRIDELLTLLLNEDVKTCRQFVERHFKVPVGESCSVGALGASLGPSPSPSHLLWSADMKGCVDVPVVAITSSVGTYIASGSFARKVAILDERGEELFGVFLPEELSAQPVFSECATFLFCPCSNGAMYCLDSRLKKISWGFPTSDKVSAACVWDTLLAFGSYNGSCYCVSFEGALVWMTRVFGQIKAPPVRDANRQRIHVGTTRGWCYALDESSGAQLWSCNVKEPVFGEGVVLEDCTVWPSVTGEITCIDSTGCVRWTRKVGGHTFGSLRLHGRSMYFGCHDSYLYKITDEAHLEKLVQLSGEISSTPCIYQLEGKVFVVGVCNSGSVHVVETASKEIVFSTQLPTQSFSSPCVVKGRLLVGCRDDRLYCIDLGKALNGL